MESKLFGPLEPHYDYEEKDGLSFIAERKLDEEYSANFEQTIEFVGGESDPAEFINQAEQVYQALMSLHAEVKSALVPFVMGVFEEYELTISESQSTELLQELFFSRVLMFFTNGSLETIVCMANVWDGPNPDHFGFEHLAGLSCQDMCFDISGADFSKGKITISGFHTDG